MNPSIASLFDAILHLETRQDCQKFFEALLTPQEITKIVNRWQVFPLLEEGLPQRNIAGRLHISLGTVSRANKVFKYGDAQCRQLLRKLQRERTTLSTA